MAFSTSILARIAVVVGIALAAMWLATQWAAAMLGYQPRLGPAWFMPLGWPIYRPWQLFTWWYAYAPYAPAVFGRAGNLAAIGGLLAGLAGWLMGLLQGRRRARCTTFGSARWASAAEIRRAGLMAGRGVILGGMGARYLRHDGPAHVIAVAPTRGGKGIGLVVPTLLSWPGSVIVHDIKGENWSLTAGWRSRFSRCLLFDPTDRRSARFNPLLEVRKGPNEVRDVQNIADILVDPEGALERRNHWEKTAHALLVGAILHVLYAEADKSLSRVASLLSDPQRSFEHTLRAMMATNHLGSADRPEVHPVVAAVARELLNKSDNERSSVLSTAVSFLTLYRDPIIETITSACDWRIADLMHAARPHSLYFVIPPSDIARTKPLIRLILNQIGRRLTETFAPEEAPAPAPGQGDRASTWRRAAEAGRRGQRRRHELLLMLDEFPALGRLDFFETALAFMAGYGIRAYLIAQSLNQVAKAYGENSAILDNCHIRIVFACSNEQTAKRISDSLGTATQSRQQRNLAGPRLALWLPHTAVSQQEVARPLLTPGEIMTLAPSDELVLVTGLAPIRASKLDYRRDANFRCRLLRPPRLTRPAPQAAGSRNDWAACRASVDPRLRQALAESEPEDPLAGAADPLQASLWPEGPQSGGPATLVDDMIILADALSTLSGSTLSGSTGSGASPTTGRKSRMPDGNVGGQP
ncbi:MAG TPA: IncP-type conjugal transfer protein TraG [Ferrovibrio sp.]|uniref:IncP-type conjugal transfer protein TraG n=1 Tax=Ferrovibrio sp. TaxID=1917215 RepID=UPI002ED24C9B